MCPVNKGGILMVFDCHSYMGHQPMWPIMGLPATFTGSEWVAYMEEAGIDRMVCAPPFSGNTDFFAADHERIAQSVKDFPGKVFGYVRVNPNRGQQAADDLLYWVRTRGLHAVKFNVSDHPSYRIDDRKLMGTVLDAVQELDIPVMVHTGEAYGITCAPSLVADIASDFPKVTFFMAHMGTPNFWEEVIPYCKRTPNLMCDTTGVFRPNLIQELVNAIGPERVMFGSNAPYMPPQLGVITVRQYCRLLSGRDKDLILGGNIARLLKVKA